MTVEQLTDSLRATLDAFDSSDPGTPLTTSEVADSLDIGRRSTYDRLDQLADRGRLETKKVGARGRVWWRPPSVEGGATDEANRAVELEPVGGVFDAADAGIAVVDENREVVWINETCGRYFGLDREEVLGRERSELVEERIAPTVSDPDAFTDAVLTTEGDITDTDQSAWQITAGEGRERRRVAHRSEPIETGRYAGGRVELYRDVTGGRRESETPRETEQRVGSLTQAVEETAVYRPDADGRVQSRNESAETSEGDDADVDPQGHTEVARGTADPRERERTVRRERDLLAGVLEASPIGIGIFDAAGDPVEVNRRFVDLLGRGGDDAEVDALDEQEFLDESGDVIPHPDRPAGRALSTGESVVDQRVRVDAPDESRWLSVNAEPLAGGFDGVVVTVADVTRLEEPPRRLERRRDGPRGKPSDVYDWVDDGFVALDEDLRIADANERAAEILRRSLDELAGECVWNALERSPEAVEAFRAVRETREPTSFEERYEPFDAWFQFQVYPSGSGLSVYIRDVTAHKERERALEESERRYRVIAEHFPNGAVVMFDGNLRYTLVEGDLPKDLGVGEEWVGEPVGEVLLPGARDEFVEHYRATLDGEASSFEVQYGDRVLHVQTVPIYDENGEVVAGTAISQDVTDRRERERRLEHQRQQLTALNNLNDIVHGITDAVIEQSTREEIETIVCDRLAASDSYQLAWIGDVDVPTLTVKPRAEAGVEGYLDEVTLTIDPENEHNNGATARAALQREVQVTRDTGSDPRDDDRREHSRQYGFRSSAAIPIVHDDTLYDVLNVYTDRPNAFTDEELEVIGRLGEIVGHAIAAVERKRALMSDEVVELELQIQDVLEIADVNAPVDGVITFDRTVPVGDGVFHEYGIATDDAIDAVEAVVESDRHPVWESLRVLEDGSEETHFELRLVDPPLVSTVSAFNGYIPTSRIEDGNYYVRAHFPPGADVRSVVDTIKEGYPEIEIATHRQVSRAPRSETQYRGTVLEELTDRQRSAVEMAYQRGYFEWPRDSTGEDIADTLGVAPSTFHQHLRKAQSRLFTALFGEGRTSRSG